MRPDTLIQLIQAGAVKPDQPAAGLVRYSVSAEELEDIKSHLPDTLTVEDIEQLQAQHPFGIEVNVSDSTFMPDTDKADNLLDFGLQSLRAVVMASQLLPISMEPIERIYQQYQQNRIALRELAIPEIEKIERAKVIIDHFFNVVAQAVDQAQPPERPIKDIARYIGEQQQVHRSQRAMMDFATIQIERGDIRHLLDSAAGTKAHVEVLQRWYERDGVIRPTATAHNHEDELANYAQKMVFHTTLTDFGPKSDELFKGASHGSLTPATRYKTSVRSSKQYRGDCSKHELTVMAHTNVQRLLAQRPVDQQALPHIYTHLITAAKGGASLESGQGRQFHDMRIAAYAEPNMVYMDYGINDFRGVVSDQQQGVNSMAMIRLFRMVQDIALREGITLNLPVDRNVYAKYISAKFDLEHVSQQYIDAVKDHTDCSSADLEVRREAVRAVEKEVHHLADNIADRIHAMFSSEAMASRMRALSDREVGEGYQQAVDVIKCFGLIQQLSERTSHGLAKMAKSTAALGELAHKKLTKSSAVTDSALSDISWKSEVANGVMQALVQVLSYKLGVSCSSGCKSANDRQAVVAHAVTAITNMLNEGTLFSSDDLPALLATLNIRRESEVGANHSSQYVTLADTNAYPKPRDTRFTRSKDAVARQKAASSNAFASHKQKSRKLSVDALLSDTVLSSKARYAPLKLIAMCVDGIRAHAQIMKRRLPQHSRASQHLLGAAGIGMKVDSIVSPLIYLREFGDKQQPVIEKLRGSLNGLLQLNDGITDMTPLWEKELIAGCNQVVYNSLNQLVGDCEAFAMTHVADTADSLNLARALVGSDRLWSQVRRACFSEDSTQTPAVSLHGGGAMLLIRAPHEPNSPPVVDVPAAGVVESKSF